MANDVLSPLLLYQPREDENGLVEICFRLAMPAQVAKGIAAVGQVHGQVNGQVGPTLLLDMIGVDGDGLVILRQGLGRLAPTLLGAAAVLRDRFCFLRVTSPSPIGSPNAPSRD